MNYGDGGGAQPLASRATRLSIAHTYTAAGDFTVAVTGERQRRRGGDAGRHGARADPQQAIDVLAGIEGIIQPLQVKLDAGAMAALVSLSVLLKGAKTGLLVTQGFRGIYEVMEQTRGYGPATYDLFFEKPRLLAPPYYTEEIPERVDFRGNVLKAIDVEASRKAIRQLKEKGRDSVAVCFLFPF